MNFTGKNLKKIGGNAFKFAGKKAYKKLTISTVKAKKKAYKKLLKKAGLNSKVKVK
jgi:hypothetical protein